MEGRKLRKSKHSQKEGYQKFERNQGGVSRGGNKIVSVLVINNGV